MASWASIAKAQVKQPQQPGSTAIAVAARDGVRLLVVDANALIDGVHLEGVADRAVTIQEVLDEIRDKQSRQFLAALPFELEVAEPADDSVAAVTKFARATGDVSALSSTDIKLMALAHTLEVAAHGADHLLTLPNQPRMHNRAAFAAQALPGWGCVPNPEDWRVVDEANEADDAAAAATSRIAQQVQQLSLDPSQHNAFLQEDLPPSATPLTPAAVAAAPAATPAPARPGSAGGSDGGSAGGPVAGATAAQEPSHPASTQQQQRQEQEQQQEAAGGDADGWEVASVSKAAARHRRRKAVKKQLHQQAFEAEWEEHEQLVQQQQQQQQAPAGNSQPAVGTPPRAAERPAGDAAPAADGAAAEQGTAGDGGAEEGATNDELLAAGHCVYAADEEADDASHQEQQQQQQAAAVSGGPGSPGWQSSVAIITGDFAMQNVLLQMGLRLLTRDGRRVARLSRYALRCSACFVVTREPGRLFCPKCGNLSLDRVEVVVGPDGAEYFGVNKRHVLRGTRYSLPKPKGGRGADEVVLREDVFLQKARALGRRPVKKKAGGEDGEDGEAAVADPFAPEQDSSAWHTVSQQELAQQRGLAAVLQPWKHNPNERKLTRSNRRG